MPKTNEYDRSAATRQLGRSMHALGFSAGSGGLEFTRDNWWDPYDVVAVDFVATIGRIRGYKVWVLLYKTAATGSTIGVSHSGLPNFRGLRFERAED